MHSVTLIPLPSRERVRVKGQKKYSPGIEEELKRRKGVGVRKNLVRNWSFNLKNLKKEEEK
jgi:hypothetical protein